MLSMHVRLRCSTFIAALLHLLWKREDFVQIQHCGFSVGCDWLPSAYEANGLEIVSSSTFSRSEIAGKHCVASSVWSRRASLVHPKHTCAVFVFYSRSVYGIRK